MSYLGGIAMIFLVVVGGIFGLYMVISHSNIATAPTDSFGESPPAQDSVVRNVTSSSATPVLYMAGAIGLIVGFMMLIAAAIYIAAAGKSNFRSRY
jgi:hypothetical protein